MQCVERLTQAPRPQPDQLVEDGFAQELDGVAGQEECDVVALVDGGPSDEKPERGTGRVLRAVCDVDQQLCHRPSVAVTPYAWLGETLGPTRIQLCGHVVAEIAGRRVEAELPGRQGRLLFVYLTLNRLRAVARPQLVDAVWPDDPPPNVDSALSALLSKLRRHVPLVGRSELRLSLPDDAWIDLEAAAEGVHRAEAAVGRGAWTEAWGPARVAQHVAVRGFLPGEGAPWVLEVRDRVETIYLRSLELVADSALRIGGGELDTAERAARTLVERAPYRESGHRALMHVLDARGNRAEALQVYERLRILLRHELGAAPSPSTQELHKTLLG